MELQEIGHHFFVIVFTLVANYIDTLSVMGFITDLLRSGFSPEDTRCVIVGSETGSARPNIDNYVDVLLFQQ